MTSLWPRPGSPIPVWGCKDHSDGDNDGKSKYDINGNDGNDAEYDDNKDGNNYNIDDDESTWWGLKSPRLGCAPCW